MSGQLPRRRGRCPVLRTPYLYERERARKGAAAAGWRTYGVRSNYKHTPYILPAQSMCFFGRQHPTGIDCRRPDDRSVGVFCSSSPTAVLPPCQTKCSPTTKTGGLAACRSRQAAADNIMWGIIGVWNGAETEQNRGQSELRARAFGALIKPWGSWRGGKSADTPSPEAREPGDRLLPPISAGGHVCMARLYDNNRRPVCAVCAPHGVRSTCN